MHQLRMDLNWAEQIAAIRDAHTDPTNILRPKLDHYRICRESLASFNISLSASTSQNSLIVMMYESDLYIHHIGNIAMGRYSSELITDENTKGKYQISKWRIDSAILDLQKTKNESKQFENQTLLTFCVAESIRCDALADLLSVTVESGASMDIQKWVRYAKNWSATSKKICRRQMVTSDLKEYALAIKTLCRSENDD